MPAARHGFLVPHQIWDFPHPENWPEDWSGENMPSQDARPGRLSVQRAWLPYILLGALLMLSRLEFLPIRGWLQSVVLTWSNIFGTEVTATAQPLYLPPTIFLVVIVITFFLHGMKLPTMGRVIVKTVPLLKKTTLALGAAVLLARVFINSGVNTAGLASMPLTLADGISALSGKIWPFFAPLMGTIGSFVAGSVTVSNLMFSLFQFGVALQIGVSTAIVLGLQCVGASAGNIICVSNIVAAEATVGLTGREGSLIRKLMVPTLYYVGFAGVIGILVMIFF